MNLISIVIPTHNRVNLLEKAVNSVINQNYNNFEIIIVDDASTDDTETRIKRFCSDKITYIRVDKSKGGNYARNLGIEKSKGQYIAFLDDDDEWMPTKLQEQMLIFDKDESIGLVYTGAEVIYTANNSKYNIIPTKKGDLSEDILAFNYIGTTSSVMARKGIIDQAGRFDIEMPALQDYDLWIRICQITKIDFVKKPLIKYYFHTNSNQITNSILKNQQAIEIIDKKYNNLITQLSKKKQNKRLCQRYNAAGKKKLRSGEKKEAREFFIRSFKSRPNCMSIKLYLASFFDFYILVRLKGLFSKKY